MTNQSKQHPNNYSLRIDLLDFYDEFVAFHDTSAFFCDAVTTMLASRDEFDSASLEGVREFSGHLRGNGEALKEKFKLILEQRGAEERRAH